MLFLGSVYWRLGEKLAESFLIDALVVGLFLRNTRVSQVVHDRVVERLIAFFLADLKHARDLVGFPFAHEIRDRGIDHQDLERGDAARFIDALEQVLRDYYLE